MSECVWQYTESKHLSSRLTKKKRFRRLLNYIEPSIAKGFEAGFQLASLSPARFELRVVGRLSQFASSRPAKKVKGSGQRVGGHCRTAWLILLRYSLIEESWPSGQYRIGSHSCLNSKGNQSYERALPRVGSHLTRRRKVRRLRAHSMPSGFGNRQSVNCQPRDFLAR